MRFLRVALLVAIAMSIGCAISPKNAGGQYTWLTFKVNLNAPIDVVDHPQYIYGIVMNLATGPTTPPTTPNEIAPVLQPGSQNGMYTGLATNAMLISNLQNTGSPVTVYFYGSAPVDSGGQSLPTNQSFTNDQLPLPDPNGDIPGQLSFTVPLNQLQPTDTQSYEWIQFQVLTMNESTLGGGSGRVMDALGVSPNYQITRWLRISQSITYGMADIYPGGLTGHTTPDGGDQALSIQSVSLQVQVP